MDKSHKKLVSSFRNVILVYSLYPLWLEPYHNFASNTNQCKRNRSYKRIFCDKFPDFLTFQRQFLMNRFFISCCVLPSKFLLIFAHCFGFCRLSASSFRSSFNVHSFLFLGLIEKLSQEYLNYQYLIKHGFK